MRHFWNSPQTGIEVEMSSRSDWRTPLTRSQLIGATAAVVAFFAPLLLVVIAGDHPIVSFPFGNALKIFAYYLILVLLVSLLKVGVFSFGRKNVDREEELD
jgi:hypothetical protein